RCVRRGQAAHGEDALRRSRGEPLGILGLQSPAYGRNSGTARIASGAARLHTASLADPARHSFDHLFAAERSLDRRSRRELFAQLLCAVALGADLPVRQAAADSVFAAYQLLRYRLYPGA